jgi:zinc protease
MASSFNSKIPFTEYDLLNGLHVILSPSKAQPIVAVNLWYHVGSKDEDPSRTGFAHLFEHLMFLGSENVGNTEHFKYIQNAGGTLNASTSCDRTNYYESLPSDRLELALWLESDRMLSLNISEEKFKTERNVVKEERRQRYENKPYGRIYETILNNLFPTSGYHWATIGSMEHLDMATIEEVRGFHKKWYVPNNASLTICGDFDTESATVLIEKYFDGIPKSESPSRPQQIIAPLSENIRVSQEDTISLPAVTIAFQTVSAYTHDNYAMELLPNILTRGKSSRLYQKLVYKQQLAKSVSCYPLTLEKSGAFVITCVAQSGVPPEKLEEAIWHELDTLQKRGVTEEELQKAKNHSIMEMSASLQYLTRRADMLQMAYAYTKETETANKELDSLLAIKREDIHSSISLFLDSGRNVTLYTLPKTK